MSTRPHYCYKTDADTEVGKQLKEFVDRCHEASEQARQWAEKQGATSYIESPEGMAGGIAALEIANCIGKEGFERIVMPNGNVIFIPAADSELEKEMYALPIVSEAELIRILRFKPRTNSKGKTLPFTFGNQTPVVFIYNGKWYVDVPYECQAEELDSITYNKLARRRSAAQKE